MVSNNPSYVDAAGVAVGRFASTVAYYENAARLMGQRSLLVPRWSSASAEVSARSILGPDRAFWRSDFALLPGGRRRRSSVRRGWAARAAAHGAGVAVRFIENRFKDSGINAHVDPRIDKTGPRLNLNGDAAVFASLKIIQAAPMFREVC
jgi:hypothetical protein